MLMRSGPETVDSICEFLRETLNNAGASGYLMGISGGVDSALAATLCCKAVGASRVAGIFLPSHVTPSEDTSDVAALAGFLSMKIETVPIGSVIDQYRTLPGFLENPYLLGNLMARTRMTLLYYYANRSSSLVCGTSNRTEYLLGYCTKHGDNAADVQPIIHLLKTEIWELARFLGIPSSIITRAPSAGLWSGQTDEGELGLAYADIDAAIRSLDLNGWIPKNDIEEKVVSRNRSSRHKQGPVPCLPVR